MLTSNIFMALRESVEGGAVGLFKRTNSECWQMCFFLEGRKVRMSTGTANKRLAQMAYEKTKAKVVTGNFYPNPESRADMPFSDLVAEFLNKHCIQPKKRRQNSLCQRSLQSGLRPCRDRQFKVPRP